MEQQEVQNVDNIFESNQESLHEKKVTVSSSDEVPPSKLSEEESKSKDNLKNTREWRLEPIHKFKYDILHLANYYGLNIEYLFCNIALNAAIIIIKNT